MKQVKLTNSKAWLVLEHSFTTSNGNVIDAVAHGLYINESEAIGKANKIRQSREHGYITIRGMSLQGKERDLTVDVILNKVRKSK